MTHLVPHPWDAVGQPAPLDPLTDEISPELDGLVDAWLDAMREYDEAEDDVDEAKGRMAEAEDKIDSLAEEILDLRPDWEGPLGDGVDPRMSRG
jgi:hypothetical protein